MGTKLCVHTTSPMILPLLYECDPTAPFFGFLGAAIALVFCCLGAAYGTAKAGVGIASMCVFHPDLVMRSIVPIILASIVGLYGLIIAVIIATQMKQEGFTRFQGYAYFASGLSVGFAGLAAGACIGITGDAGVRAAAQQEKLFTANLLIGIFAEALGLYGLIVGLILSFIQPKTPCTTS